MLQHRQTSAGPPAPRRWRAIAVAGLVLVAGACDRDGASTGTAPPGSEATPDASVVGTEVIRGEIDAADGERFRTDGLTFVFPTEVYSSAAEQPASDTTDAVAVDLATSSGAGQAEVVVTMVRSVDGVELPALSDEQRELLARLERTTDQTTDPGNGPEGDVVAFVNGVGENSVDGESYRYDGVTADGRFLVIVTGHGDDRDALNRIVSSLFVDSAAARFAGEVCEEAVELLNENGLSEGETVGPGEEVTATWDLRNTGTCTWDAGYSWVYTGGEPVAIVATTVSPDEVAPDESARMTVTFLAPEAPGRYAAQWQLQPPRSFTAVAPAAFALFEVVD